MTDAGFRDALIKLIWEWFELTYPADGVDQLYVDTKIMPLIRLRVAEARLHEQTFYASPLIGHDHSICAPAKDCGLQCPAVRQMKRIAELEAELAAAQKKLEGQ